jgi:twinkle protein
MIKFVGNPRLTDCCEVATIEDVVTYCKSKDILAVDTETTGLNFMEETMTMLQIGDTDIQFVVDVRACDISPLKEILESKQILKILHNAKFDYKFLLKAGIKLENVWDTMLASQVLNCGKKMSHSLDNLVSRVLQISMSKDTRSTFVGHTGEFTESQIIYGAKDVEYLLQIQSIQKTQIDKLNLTMLMQLENDATLAYGDIEFNGIGLDVSTWRQLAKDAQAKRVEMENELDQYIHTKPKLSKFVASAFQTDLFMDDSDIRKVNVKWTSPKQVLDVFTTYGLDIEDVNANTLHVFRKDEFIDLYIKYKEQSKLATSYGDKFLKNVDSDNRIRTNFKQILNTGRIASSAPNMQQIPADNAYRNCFISGHDDWVFVSSDYSSQELAIIATGSKDPVWLAALSEGKDLHSVCADLVYGPKWKRETEDGCNYSKNQSKCNCKGHKKLRTNVKSINFG